MATNFQEKSTVGFVLHHPPSIPKESARRFKIPTEVAPGYTIFQFRLPDISAVG